MLKDSKVWVAVYEGEDDDKTGEEDKTFTQEEVNEFLAKDKRKHQDKLKKAMDEVESLRKKSNLTSEEKADLDKRMEQLGNELLTEKEKAKKDRDKLSKQAKEREEELLGETDKWKNLYTDSTIRTAIISAAVGEDAFTPEQIVAILRSTTQIVEVLDSEGKPTGQYKPQTKIEDKKDDGTSQTLTVDVLEAVKKLKETPEYFNLFKGKGSGGTGGSGGQGGGAGSPSVEEAKNMTPEQYRKWRENNDFK